MQSQFSLSGRVIDIKQLTYTCTSPGHPLFGNVGRLPRLEPRETYAWSGAGGHVGGQDVVRVAVQVLAGPVIPHSGTGIGVTGGDLDVA
jgi:hypothetical protein